MPNVLKICKTVKDVEELIQHCLTTGYCSFDFETNAEPYYEESSYPTIMGVSFQPGSSWVVPLGHYDSPFKKNYPKILKMFKEPIFENYKIVKIAWNLKFEYKWCMRYGIMLKGRLFDGMLAKYCLDEERPNGLKEFVAKYIPEFAGYELSVKGRGWAKIPLDELSLYCGIDCDTTLRAMLFLEPKLIEKGFYNLFRNLLMMMTRVLAESEFQGMKIDRKYLEEQMALYEAKIATKEAEMKADKNVAKFERKMRQRVNAELIEILQLEIAEIEKGSSKQKTRMVLGRNEKIAQVVAGTFTGKAGKKKAYEGFNFNSPDQMIQFLFSKTGMGFKVIKYTEDKKTKQDTERPSTDEFVILELQKKHPDNTFLKKLLELREMCKLYSTYLKGTHELLSTKDRVHADFHLLTVTGRLGCREPNLQNIPRDNTSSDIKPMFIPDEGFLLAEVDYGQAELRIAAEISKEPVMIDMFKRGYNIHLATALKVYEKSLDRYDEIKKLLKDINHPDNLQWERKKKKAKTLNFGIIYGQGDEKLAEGMNKTDGLESAGIEVVTLEEAQEFKKGWFATYPTLVKYMDAMQAFVRKHGYIRNLFGRKRRLPDGMFKDKWDAKANGMMGKYLEAMRQAVNAPIQGAASDFTSFSEVVIREKVKLGQLPRYFKQYYTVHDSIGYPIVPSHAAWVFPKVIEICDNPQTKKYFGFKLKYVKMKVSPELGVNWGNLREWYPGMDAVEFKKSETKRLHGNASNN